MTRILYLGNENLSSTSAHRATALRRLGYTVEVFDPYEAIVQQFGFKWFSPFHFRTGYRFLQAYLFRWLNIVLDSTKQPDLIWVNSGELLGPRCLKLLKKTVCPVVLYNNDDPTGGRDGRRFDSLIAALPHYDLCTVMRKVNVAEYHKKEVKRVMRVTMSFDEVAHRPFDNMDCIPIKFRSDVAFIGSWMRHEKRDEFLLHLINQGVPVSIWGGRWEKSPHWLKLKNHYRGGAIGGRDYVAAMQGAKICLGLLSKGNRDLHTQRSFEVPFAGGLLCAERTSEHQELYREGTEAVFWSDATECAQVCHELLVDDARRERIRLAGMQRVRALGVGNEDICRKILNEIAVFQEA